MLNAYYLHLVSCFSIFFSYRSPHLSTVQLPTLSIHAIKLLYRFSSYSVQWRVKIIEKIKERKTTSPVESWTTDSWFEIWKKKIRYFCNICRLPFVTCSYESVFPKNVTLCTFTYSQLLTDLEYCDLIIKEISIPHIHN